MGGQSKGGKRDYGASPGVPFNAAVGQIPGGLVMASGYTGMGNGMPAMPMAPWTGQGFGQFFMPNPSEQADVEPNDSGGPISSMQAFLGGPPMPFYGFPAINPYASAQAAPDPFGKGSMGFDGFVGGANRCNVDEGAEK